MHAAASQVLAFESLTKAIAISFAGSQATRLDLEPHRDNSVATLCWKARFKLNQFHRADHMKVRCGSMLLKNSVVSARWACFRSLQDL